MHGLQLTEVLLCHLVPSVMVGNEAVTGDCGEWRVSVVPQVEPLLSPPLHRFGHMIVEIGIDTLPGLDVDNHASQNCQHCIRVLWTRNAKEIIPQVEVGIYHHVSITQSHKGPRCAGSLKGVSWCSSKR
jgi:hypothetical protein